MLRILLGNFLLFFFVELNYIYRLMEAIPSYREISLVMMMVCSLSLRLPLTVYCATDNFWHLGLFLVRLPVYSLFLSLISFCGSIFSSFHSIHLALPFALHTHPRFHSFFQLILDSTYTISLYSMLANKYRAPP